jgi:hypothetical protein
MPTTEGTRAVEDAASCWRLLSERIASETDERLRSNLQVVFQHIETEYLGDMPNLMATLVADPVYAYVGMPFPAPRGRDAVEARYASENKKGRRHIFELTRVVADRHCVMLEGVMHNALWGTQVLERGDEVPGGVEPAERYHFVQEMLVVLPISDDGLIEGERAWFGGAQRLVGPLAPAERESLAALPV